MTRVRRFFHRWSWLQISNRSWREPLALGLALLVLATVCLHAVPAAASERPLAEEGTSARLFCMLFQTACPPTTFAVPADQVGKELPPVFLGSDTLNQLVTTGESATVVSLAPADDQQKPEVRLYLVDWLKGRGHKILAWLSR